MAPKPQTKQIRKPAQQRKLKPSIVNLQLAVDPSVEYSATAVNSAGTSAMPPPFRAPVPGPISMPVPDTQMAPGYVDLYTIFPPSSSHSASSALPSPSLTDEESRDSAHAQTGPYGQPMTSPAEIVMPLHSAHENTSNQAMNDQNHPTIGQRSVQEPNQPTTKAVPLHRAMIWAISVLRQRIDGFKEDTCTYTANISERYRYGTLFSACQNLDSVYLIVHQQYCCWKTDRTIAYASLFPVSPELVDTAFDEFHDLFGDERQMTDPHWLWWSKFPGFGNIAGHDRIYSQAKDFIATFAMNWPDMKESLLSQMMLPMAYQLRHNLRCVSTTIASALFTSIRRAIGVPDGTLSTPINHLFSMDTRQELAFEEQNFPLEEVKSIRSTVMASYMMYVREAREQARQSVSAAPAAANPLPRVPAPLPPTNRASINRDTNTNRPDAPPQQQQRRRRQQHLAQLSQGPPQRQTHAAMNRQPHAAPPQPSYSHQRPHHLENPQPVHLSAIHPPTQPAASFQTQPPSPPPPPPPPQQSGLRYPTGVIECQQTSRPLIVPRPGQPVLKHPNLLPPIIPPQDDMEPTPPAVMPQQPPSHNRSPPHPPPIHPPHPRSHPQPRHQSHNLAPSHGHNQSLDARPMQHPLQTAQGPLPPPWAREPQVQTPGNGSHQIETPLSPPSNGPFPFLSHPHHHMPPAQAPQASQTPSASQVPQAPWTPQPPQVSQDPQLVMAPRALMTPQPHQIYHAPAQMMQTPGMHYIRSQMHPQNHHSPSESSPASTNSQPNPHYTTHVLHPNRYPQSPHDWTSLQAGLHLTHLRSPSRVSSSPDRGFGARRTQYYQFFSEFILEPREIHPHTGIAALVFDIAQEDLDSLAITTASSDSDADELIDEIPVSRHFNNSHRYRARLCESRKQEGQPIFDPATWSQTPTHWPPHFFVSFNGKVVHVRRKQHFHHDLPIELTDSLVAGENMIKVNLPTFPQNLKKDVTYFMAVELITILNHDSVWDLVISEPHTSIEATKNQISRRLQRLETGEIVIESDTLTVAIADTFSSKLFDVPVRGRQCVHLECFDLQNWLASRPSKWSQEEGEPSMVDSWGCPLCGKDARPCNLSVDDFFVEIRDKILESNKSNIKKIEIHADGTWTPIEEADEDDGSSDRDGAPQDFSDQGAHQGMVTDADDMMHHYY